jgi:hypothetical protein
MKILITETQFENVFLGKRVMVYYNLHKHTFSVTFHGKVIVHADFVKLDDVEFRVRQGGLQRVRDEKRKNVHAFVIGNLVDFCEHPCQDFYEEPSDMIVTYDPYEFNSFILKSSKQPIYAADNVELINGKNKIFVVEN